MKNFNSPVAFLIFNRPQHTARVWEAIKQLAPRRLLIVGDGARVGRAGEAELVAQTRKVVSEVTWNCEVSTNFSEQNLGCKRRVSSGLKWIFETVEEAIILEDDCLPAPSFFRFCDELLERYRSDQRIGMISGDNFLSGRARSETSYYFTRHTHIWGWASWRRAMAHYDPELKKWPEVRAAGWLYDILGRNEDFVRYWTDQFDRVYNGEIDTWDYQLTLSLWLAGCVNIQPNTNLISNIGFGPEATHTKHDGKFAALPAREMEFPLKHPEIVVRDDLSDDYTERNVFGILDYVKSEPRRRSFPSYSETVARFEGSLANRKTGRLVVGAPKSELAGRSESEQLGWEILRLFAGIKIHEELKEELLVIPSEGLSRIFKFSERIVSGEKPRNGATKIVEFGYDLKAAIPYELSRLGVIGLRGDFGFGGSPCSMQWVPSVGALSSVLEVRGEMLAAVMDGIPELRAGGLVISAESCGESGELRGRYYRGVVERVRAAGGGSEVVVVGGQAEAMEVLGILSTAGVRARGVVVGAVELWFAMFAARQLVAGFGPLSWSASLFNKELVLLPSGIDPVPNSVPL